MRFGVFVPQGWRLNLVGIDVKDHWATMLRIAQRAEAGPWESIWVFDHFIDAAYDPSGMELFATEVAPEFT